MWFWVASTGSEGLCLEGEWEKVSTGRKGMSRHAEGSAELECLMGSRWEGW